MMERHQRLELSFDGDVELCGQGADGTILRALRSLLMKVADTTGQESVSLMHPTVMYRIFKIEGVQHERLLLNDGLKIDRKLVAQQFRSDTDMTRHDANDHPEETHGR